uniref:Uncharacterized protein n=1 Tax=Eutreptiella gymnastica TaxID=73025 RepID=A0A7S4LDQ8_9EUGL
MVPHAVPSAGDVFHTIFANVWTSSYVQPGGLHLKPVLLNMLLASGIGAAADSMVQVFYEDRLKIAPCSSGHVRNCCGDNEDHEVEEEEEKVEEVKPESPQSPQDLGSDSSSSIQRMSTLGYKSDVSGMTQYPQPPGFSWCRMLEFMGLNAVYAAQVCIWSSLVESRIANMYVRYLAHLGILPVLVVEHLAYRELLVRKGRKRPLSLWQIGLQDTALAMCSYLFWNAVLLILLGLGLPISTVKYFLPVLQYYMVFQYDIFMYKPYRSQQEYILGLRQLCSAGCCCITCDRRGS